MYASRECDIYFDLVMFGGEMMLQIPRRISVELKEHIFSANFVFCWLY